MVWSRVRSGVVVLGVLAAAGAALAATGALGEREDAQAPEIALGEALATSRADLVVEAFEPAEGGYAVTLTLENHLRESLMITDVLTLVDDRGELAGYGYTTVAGDIGVTAAQPGVSDTFTILYEPDREAVGDVRVEIVDATWTPRDETAFGLGSNMYDVHVVATVGMP